jgi:hypothetical protein
MSRLPLAGALLLLPLWISAESLAPPFELTLTVHFLEGGSTLESVERQRFYDVLEQMSGLGYCRVQGVFVEGAGIEREGSGSEQKPPRSERATYIARMLRTEGIAYVAFIPNPMARTTLPEPKPGDVRLTFRGQRGKIGCSVY